MVATAVTASRIHRTAIAATAASATRIHRTAIAATIVTVTRVHRTTIIATTPATSTEINTIASASTRTDATRTDASRTSTSYATTHSRRRTMHIVTTHSTIPYRPTIAVETSMMVVMTVSATIGYPNTGIAIIEEPAIITRIYRKKPMSGAPYNRTQEIIGCKKQAILPIVQDATQVADSVVVIDTIEVGRSTYTEEVIEVDLVGIIILLVVEVEFIGHLIGQVESFCLCTFETHCIGTHPGCHHDYERKDKLFHSRIGFAFKILIHTAKVRTKTTRGTRIFPKQTGKSPIIAYRIY
jgi:hypothetical protein